MNRSTDEYEGAAKRAKKAKKAKISLLPFLPLFALFAALFAFIRRASERNPGITQKIWAMTSLKANGITFRQKAPGELTIANWPLPIVSQEEISAPLRNNWQWPIGNGQWLNFMPLVLRRRYELFNSRY
jgi:hypothetical protein